MNPSIFCLSGFLSRGKRHPNLPLAEPFPDQPNQYLGAASQGNPRTVVVLSECKTKNRMNMCWLLFKTSLSSLVLCVMEVRDWPLSAVAGRGDCN